MTTARPQRKSSAEKAARSHDAHRKFWEERFAAAETPMDLVQETWAMLRARLVQIERKALVRVERAGTREQRLEAEQRLVETRTQIKEICAAAASELARLADEIKTGRR